MTAAYDCDYGLILYVYDMCAVIVAADFNGEGESTLLSQEERLFFSFT
jgi:hypothetical protein